ncbi:uncharacterized protein B0H64DRAFT_388530 [Chaetomium fimeti]|uniref:F-box domain-containing protein n=1 Tax=Chaetomium fimeti TaxID=1854472 RepID=A0AAE0HMW4_9PEZI|nr:hypothetical protein B0H64DRAFT_388530 [Chaetomium fimeti]
MCAMLQNLPPELVQQITGSVGDADILHLRSTCRQLYEKTFPAFATAFFGCVTVDLCPKPLERLRQIADDERLRLYVRKLVVGELANGCPNPPRHLPGTGHCWARDPSTGCLDPSSPVICDLRAIVSRLVNCYSVAVRDENEANEELREPSETGGLLLMDTVHVALLLANGLQTIRSFQIVHEPSMIHGYTRSLLPRSVAGSLGESWASNLVDLHLQWYSMHDPDSLLVLVDLVLGARSLRKLCMRGAPAEFYRRLAAAPPDDLPLTVLDVRHAPRDMTSDVLASLTSRFRRTLEHLYVRHVRLSDPENWTAVLRDWARNLGHLKSFGVQTLLGKAGRKMLLFSPILEWEGMPTAGRVQFTTKRAAAHATRREVDGVRYENRTRVEDVQSVLRELADCSYLLPGFRPITSGMVSTRGEYRIGGGLLAEEVRVLHSPDASL